MQKYIPLILLLSFLNIFSQEAEKSIKKDTLKKAKLPLKVDRKIKLQTDEGTWMSLDISPDGKTIAFDMLGDIYTLPIDGGKATRITSGLAVAFMVLAITIGMMDNPASRIDFSNKPTLSRNEGTGNAVSAPTVDLQPIENNEPLLVPTENKDGE